MTRQNYHFCISTLEQYTRDKSGHRMASTGWLFTLSLSLSLSLSLYLSLFSLSLSSLSLLSLSLLSLSSLSLSLSLSLSVTIYLLYTEPTALSIYNDLTTGSGVLYQGYNLSLFPSSSSRSILHDIFIESGLLIIMKFMLQASFNR